MEMMMVTMMILSIKLMMMSHPLSMGLILLMMTLMTAMITSTMNNTSMFSYILFLIMAGGMMVLFMYMTSIASNEKFKPNMKKIMLTPPIIMVTAMLTMKYTPFMENSTMMKMNENINTTASAMSKYMNMPSNTIVIMVIMYLLIALMATVKISKMSKGPLRQMN